MRIILSPAKKMVEDLDSLAPKGLPRFLPEAERLVSALQTLSPAEAQALWSCSDSLAELNLRRLRDMDLHTRLTPAILAYEGIQYQYMAPGVLEESALSYIQERLRIVSGLYGLLRPFDGVTPYRLEMQAKLPVDGSKDLYGFWGSKLGEALGRETDLVLDLASKEYSSAVLPHLPQGVRVLRCVFGEEKKGRVVEKGTFCKMARGLMVRFMAEHQAETAEALRDFSGLGFSFSEEHSDESTLVYIREPEKKEDF